MTNDHTNIIIINIPARYDLINSNYANKTITKLNRKIQKLIKINPHTKFLVTSDDNKQYTKQGLHYNKQGKRLVNLQIASSLLATFTSDPKSPIILDWHDLNTAEIHSEVKPNRNSCRTKKTPVTDFLWPV